MNYFWDLMNFLKKSMNFLQSRWTFFLINEIVLKFIETFPTSMNLFFKSVVLKRWWTFCKICWTFFKSMNHMSNQWTFFSNEWSFCKIYELFSVCELFSNKYWSNSYFFPPSRTIKWAWSSGCCATLLR